MRKVLVALIVLGSLEASTAKAQWGMRILPPLVVVQEENWRPVIVTGASSYFLNGTHHYVNDNGLHHQAVDGGKAYAMTTNQFVEPFDSFGRRIEKSISIPLPAGTRRTTTITWNVGGNVIRKTYAFTDSQSFFPTWIRRSNGDAPQMVWVTSEVSSSEPTPATTVPSKPNPVQLGPGIEPIEDDEELTPVPKRNEESQDGDPFKAPEFPPLQAPSAKRDGSLKG